MILEKVKTQHRRVFHVKTWPKVGLKTFGFKFASNIIFYVKKLHKVGL